MSRSIYVTSAEGNSGKSTVALGLVDTLSHQVQRVGVFRPVARSQDERDYVLEVLLGHSGVDLDYEDCIGVGYDEVHADQEAALAVIVERFKAIERRSDAVVIVGSDYTDVASPTELSFNARVAANLGACRTASPDGVAAAPGVRGAAPPTRPRRSKCASRSR